MIVNKKDGYNSKLSKSYINNKKGVLLIEAIIAVGILIGFLAGLSQLFTISTKMREISEKTLGITAQTQLVNSLEFIKKRTISSEERFGRATANNQLAGWLSVPVTADGLQTFNQLDGIYRIRSGGDCQNSYLREMRCLEKITNTEYGSIPLRYELNLYEDDSGVSELKTNIFESATDLECSDEFSSSCLGYQLEIKDMSAGRQGDYNYKLSDGQIQNIRSKSVKVKIFDGSTTNNLPLNSNEYDYILSPITK